MLEERIGEAVNATDPRERAALAAEAGDQLAVHVAAEEAVFYPAVKARCAEGIAPDSLEEHLSLKRLLAELLDLPADDPAYEAKLKGLREQAERHHADEEEHLFPRARRGIDAGALESLGRQMLELQKQLLREGQPRATVAERMERAAAA